MIQKTNELLKSELGKLIREKIELPNILITITSVHCSEDLGHANIFVSIIPDGHAGSTLSALKKQSSAFSKAIKERTRLRHVPRLHWNFDGGQVHASELDTIFKQIENERNSHQINN